jgi:hypothetical protein
MDAVLTFKEIEALHTVAGEKLAAAFESVDGAAYVFWLDILCKLTVQKEVSR